MAYTITRYNREILTNVDEGTIDRTTDLLFVGKNYSGYGEQQNENFLYLLENFSGGNPPGKALSGQLWYDSDSQKIRVYNEITWRKLGVTTTNDTEPDGQVLGDFWWDTSKEQLYAYNGTNHELIGPERAGPNITRMVSLEVTDIDENPHYIITAVANGRTVFVISETEFQLSAESAITGFSVIKKGITLIDSSNATGVTESDHWFWGTASNSEKLDDLDSTQFLRSDVNTTLTGNLSLDIDNSTIAWANDAISISGSGADSKLEITTRSNDVVLFKANTTETLKIDPTTGLLGLTFRGSTVWTQANDGSGSGLDADLLDGLDSTQYLRSDVDTALTGEFVFTDSGTGLNWLSRNITIKAYDDSDKLEFATRTNDDIVFKAGLTETLKIIPENGTLGLTFRGATVWTSANDGPGSGLNADRLDGYSHEDFLKVNAKAVDADKLDGLDSSKFVRSDVNDTMSARLTVNEIVVNAGEGLELKNGGARTSLSGTTNNDSRVINLRDSNPGTDGALFITADQSVSGDAKIELVYIDTNKFEWKGNTIWHRANDGSGSGLDADLLDGYQHTDFLKVNGKAVDSALADYAQNSNRLDGYNHTDFLKVNGKAVNSAKADYASYAENSNRLDGYDHSAFLKRAGGSMTGFITLHSNPTAAMHAATKGYVDYVVGNVDPYWAGESTLASVKATYANYPVNTRVSFWQVRTQTRGSGNGGTYTFYDRFRRTIKKTGSTTWVDVGG
jgi:hypothetical protein